jgi:hypothetical protein
MGHAPRNNEYSKKTWLERSQIKEVALMFGYGIVGTILIVCLIV